MTRTTDRKPFSVTFTSRAKKRAAGHGLHQALNPCLVATSSSRLQCRIDALEQKLAKAHRRLALVDDDLYEDVRDTVRELHHERDGLASQMTASKLPRNRLLLDADEKVDAAMQLFSRLTTAFQKADTGLARNFLHEAIDHVDLQIDQRQQGQRHRYKFRRGTIYFAGSAQAPATLPGEQNRL